MCGQRFVSVLLSLCLFGLSFPALSYSEEAPSLTAYESELARLRTIFARLQAISIQLDLRLSESEKSLQSLRGELESLRAELADIKSRLTTSLTESEALAEMLAKSETSLSKVTASFQKYKDAAETKIKRLEKSLRFHRLIEKAAIAAALGLGGYLVASKL